MVLLLRLLLLILLCVVPPPPVVASIADKIDRDDKEDRKKSRDRQKEQKEIRVDIPSLIDRNITAPSDDLITTPSNDLNVTAPPRDDFNVTAPPSNDLNVTAPPPDDLNVTTDPPATDDLKNVTAPPPDGSKNVTAPPPTDDLKNNVTAPPPPDDLTKNFTVPSDDYVFNITDIDPKVKVIDINVLSTEEAVAGMKNDANGPRLARHFFPSGQPGFYHGVASGSPTSESIIFWTRYTPENATDMVLIEYRIAPVPPDLQLHRHVGNDKDNDNNDEPSPQPMEVNEELQKLMDPALNGANIRYGRVLALPENDWTLKLDVGGLTPKTTYVYAFTDGSAVSPVGVTKTLPSSDDPVKEGLRFALFSCANMKAGYFHVYDIARRIVNLDFWVHVGDYIYEAAVAPLRRQVLPSHECRTLQDYRLRYHSYHTDEALQRLRATAPLIATWDDHEFSDNASKHGSRKHSTAEDGNYGDRIRAAVQAYFEWMPIRAGEQRGGMGPYLPPRLTMTQTYEFGRLATLFTCDTRLRRRSDEPARRGDPLRDIKYAHRKQNGGNHDIKQVYRNESSIPYQIMKRQALQVMKSQFDASVMLMGPKLVQRLAQVFEKSKQAGKPWQIFAAPVMMGYNVWPAFDRIHKEAPKHIRPRFRHVLQKFLTTTREGGRYRATIPLHIFRVCQAFDDWCGAAHERQVIYEALQHNATTPIILGGDVHTSWAMKLYSNGRKGTPIGVNVGGAPVTSRGERNHLDQSLQKFKGRDKISERDLYQIFHDAWYASNKGMQYADLVHRGFTAVHVTQNHTTYDFLHVHDKTVRMNYQRVPRDPVTGLPPFFCGMSLQSQAGVPGSLRRIGGWQHNGEENCTSTTPMSSLDTPLWKVVVPPQFTNSLSPSRRKT